MRHPGLTGSQLRAVRFRRRSWWGGLDPTEVYGLLAGLADELDLLRRDVRVAQADADRMRSALRDWQTRNARASDRRWRGGR